MGNAIENNLFSNGFRFKGNDFTIEHSDDGISLTGHFHEKESGFSRMVQDNLPIVGTVGAIVTGVALSMAFSRFAPGFFESKAGMVTALSSFPISGVLATGISNDFAKEASGYSTDTMEITNKTTNGQIARFVGAKTADEVTDVLNRVRPRHTSTDNTAVIVAAAFVLF